MRADDTRIAVVREWIQKAENDLVTAAHTLKLGRECPTDTVCYHAQQCLEKYLKAACVWLGREVPRTHNLAKLADILKPRVSTGMSDTQLELLTTYAVNARYPGGMEPLSIADARSAVSLARRVRREIRRHLPRKALQRVHR